MRAAGDGVRSVGILSTRGARIGGVFAAAAHEAGVDLLYPAADSAVAIEKLIYRQKQGEIITRGGYEPYLYELYSMGADAVILGCTEISVAFAGNGDGRIYDALELLAALSVRSCLGDAVKENADAILAASAG